MKRHILIAFIFSFFILIEIGFPTNSISEEIKDFANLNAYREKNTQLMQKEPINNNRVVFMGDSITEFWDTKLTNLFANPNYINRGISGQTTPQMLLRFRQDVVALRPKIVIILAGTNDIAGNTGPATPQMIMDNIKSMAEIAKANKIRPILCTLVPANRYYWNEAIKPVEPIDELNKLIRAYAKEQKITLIDYFTPMVDSQMGLKKEYGDDGVHPNSNGYLIMNDLVAKALKAKYK